MLIRNKLQNHTKIFSKTTQGSTLTFDTNLSRDIYIYIYIYILISNIKTSLKLRPVHWECTNLLEALVLVCSNLRLTEAY